MTKGGVWVYRPDHPNADSCGMIPKDEAPPLSGVFHFWRDIPAYKSPLGGWEVTSRSQRREELKRNGLREVEPSERSPYQNADFMRKHGIMEP